jgi:hypothetical protein
MVLAWFSYISLLLTCSIRLGCRGLCTLGGSEGSRVCCTASDPLCPRMLPLAWAPCTCRSDLSSASTCLTKRLHNRRHSPIGSIRLGCRGLCTLGGPKGSRVCCTASDPLCPCMLPLAWASGTCRSDLSSAHTYWSPRWRNLHCIHT